MLMRVLIRSLVVAVFAASLAACNTVKGVGKDIKKAGEQLEEAAEKHD